MKAPEEGTAAWWAAKARAWRALEMGLPDWMEYCRVRAERAEAQAQLAREGDALLERMQTPAARAATDALFRPAIGER